MNKHTEGPWEISKHATPDYAPQYGIHNGGRNDFCIVTNENAEANARLIAAAPDLLAICQSISEAICCDGELNNSDIAVIAELEVAIAKAIGD